MKKIFLFLILFLMFTPLFITNADESNSAVFNIKSETKENVFGVEYTKTFATTTSNAYPNPGEQMINLFSLKTDGKTSKLVSWGMQSSPDKLTRVGLTNIAEDYEKKHPGWLVVCGVNGDQYFQYFGSDLVQSGSFYYVPQPYYPLIIDGERRFSSSPLGNKTSFVGVANNGQPNSYIYPSTLDKYYLEILNDKNEVTEKIAIDKINDTPNENEVAVWMGYNNTVSNGEYVEQVVESTSKLYIVELADIAYMSNSRQYDIGAKEDTLFGRGTVSKIDTSATIGRWAMAVEGNKLADKISEGTKIRVQAYYTDDNLNNVEAAFGYHSQQRMNNEDVPSTAPYNTNRYNRSIFGRKADGTYILLTIARGDVNGGTYAGTSHDESNKILEHYGIVEAYQQDGGGSVTAVVRNKAGSFDVVNESSDSSVKQRNILSGCFFVVRDPGYACYGKDSTRTSLTLSKVSNYNDDIIDNVYAVLNGNKYYPNEDKNIVIENLNDDTEYEIELHYQIEGSEQVVKYTGKTDAIQLPKPGIIVKESYPNKLKIEYTDKYYKDYRSMYVSVYKKNTLVKEEIELKNFGDTHIFDGLDKITVYTLRIRYSIYDELTSKEVEGIYDLEVTTERNNCPIAKINNVENIDNKKVKISFNIEDKDNICVGGYIYYKKVSETNFTKYYVELTDNEALIEGLDLENSDYVFKVVVLNTEMNAFESDEITVSKKEIKPVDSNPSDNPNQPGDQVEQETTTKKKCGRKNSIIVELLAMISLMAFIIKKKK